MSGHHIAARRVSVRASLARLGAVLVGLAVAVIGVRASGLRVQHTASLPRGLYRTVPGAVVRGAIGMWCLPESTARRARARGYLRAGACPGRVEPIGKVVLAVGGDTVQLGPDGVRMNGHMVPRTRPLPRDANGAPVPHAAFGTYVLASGSVWLWSPYADRSFDSRYFGPISTRALVSLVRPLWTTQ